MVGRRPVARRDWAGDRPWRRIARWERAARGHRHVLEDVPVSGDEVQNVVEVEAVCACHVAGAGCRCWRRAACTSGCATRLAPAAPRARACAGSWWSCRTQRWSTPPWSSECGAGPAGEKGRRTEGEDASVGCGGGARAQRAPGDQGRAGWRAASGGHTQLSLTSGLAGALQRPFARVNACARAPPPRAAPPTHTHVWLQDDPRVGAQAAHLQAVGGAVHRALHQQAALLGRGQAKARRLGRPQTVRVLHALALAPVPSFSLHARRCLLHTEAHFSASGESRAQGARVRGLLGV